MNGNRMRIATTMMAACFGLGFGAMGVSAWASESVFSLHVTVDGDDTAAGSETEPLQTLPEAKQRVRDYLADEPLGDVEVILHNGVHRGASRAGRPAH